MDNHKNINLELLKKFFDKNCSKHEQQIVIKWFLEEAYEQNLRTVLKANWDEIDFSHHELDENTFRVLDKIHIEIEKETNRDSSKGIHLNRKKKNWEWLKYAAMIAVLISTGSVFYYSNFSEKAISQKVISEIKPGYEKATLILANGEEVNLEEKKENVLKFNSSIQIKNKDKVLSYTTNKTDSMKIDDAVFKEIEYNTLKVPAGGIYQVVLADGTKVWLNSASSLKYPVSFNTSDQRIVELSGEGFFDVTQSDKKFIVKTSKVDIAVLGTKFNVSSYAGDKFISTTLVEGAVVLSNDYNSIVLKPNDQGYLNKDSNKFYVKNVDVKLFTAWREGKFYFEKQKLKDLLKIVGRWYDVQIIIESPVLEEKLFTGVINKKDSFKHLLKMISQSLNIEYELNKNKLNNEYELKVLKK